MPYTKNSFTNNEINYVKKNIINKTQQEIADDLGIPLNKVVKICMIYNITNKVHISNYILHHNEKFIDVKNFEGLYKISNYGTVYGIKRGYIISESITKDGYHIVRLNKKGKRYTFRVSRLVMLNFHPIKNSKNFEVNHKDGNKDNNYDGNLEWSTPKENKKHAVENNLIKHQYGVIHNRIINDEIVIEIYKLIQKGYKNYEIYNKLIKKYKYLKNLKEKQLKNCISGIKSNNNYKSVIDKYVEEKRNK